MAMKRDLQMMKKVDKFVSALEDAEDLDKLKEFDKLCKKSTRTLQKDFSGQ